MNRDLYNNLKIVTQSLPLNRTVTNTTVTGVNSQGAESAVVVAHVGLPLDTLSGSIYIEFEVQESTDGTGSGGGAWTAAPDSALQNPVSGATATGTFARIVANAGASKVYMDGYIGIANFIRVVERRTGTHTSGTPTSTCIIQSNLDYRPAAGNAS